MLEKWPFDQPRNCATVTLKTILNGKEPILLVFHDEDDHGWQFLGGDKPQIENGALVCLSEILEIDPSVREVAHIEPGTYAFRESKNSPWKFGKIEDMQEW
jgi:hypothetical protein